MNEVYNKAIELIKRDKLRKKNRKRELINKRIFIFSMLRNEGMTFQQIADLFNLNHSTVIHGINRYKDLKSTRDFSLNLDTQEYKCFFEDKNFSLHDDILKAKTIKHLMLIKDRIKKGLY
jgi:hypothetical protein